MLEITWCLRVCRYKDKKLGFETSAQFLKTKQSKPYFFVKFCVKKMTLKKTVLIRNASPNKWGRGSGL